MNFITPVLFSNIHPNHLFNFGGRRMIINFNTERICTAIEATHSRGLPHPPLSPPSIPLDIADR